MCCSLLRPLARLLIVFAAANVAIAQSPMPANQDPGGAVSDEALRESLPQRYEEVNRSIAADEITGDAAAQALFKILMLADIVGDTAIGDEMRVRLILDYPTTLQAQSLIVELPNGSAHRGLLMQGWGREPRSLTAAFYRKFNAAVRLGNERGMPDFFADNDFLLVSALAAQQTGDDELFKALQAALAQVGQEPAKVLTISRGPTSAREKFLQLVPLCHLIATTDFCDVVYSQITAKERESADIAEGRVRQLMAARRYEDASTVIEGLAAREPTPRRLLWQAWAQMLTHRTDEALRTLDAIDAIGQEHELADECQQLRMAATSLQANTDAYVTAIKKSLASMAQDGEVQAIEFTIRPPGNDSGHAYLGVDFEAKAIGVALVASGAPVFSCRIENNISTFYFRGEKRVIAYRNLKMFPILNQTLKRSADGRLNYRYFLGVNSSGNTSVPSLLESHWFKTDEGLQALLNRQVETGCLPMPIETLEAQSGRRLRWISLNADLTGHATDDIYLSEDDRVTALKLPTVELTSIRYGRSGSVQLSMPAMPDHPVEWREEFDAIAFFEVIGSVAKLVEDYIKQNPVGAK